MKKSYIRMIRWYQKYLSPALGNNCRYYPSCSQYMIDAVNTHGLSKGILMGSARICRCHPFVPGGIDYVPPYVTLKRNSDETYQGPYLYPVMEHPQFYSEISLKDVQNNPRLATYKTYPKQEKDYIEFGLAHHNVYAYQYWNRTLIYGVLEKKEEHQILITPQSFIFDETLKDSHHDFEIFCLQIINHLKKIPELQIYCDHEMFSKYLRIQEDVIACEQYYIFNSNI